MKKNMGTFDRIIRLVLAAAIGILMVAGEITGVTAMLVGFFGIVFLLTSAIGTCPLYLPFNISTAKKKGE